MKPILLSLVLALVPLHAAPQGTAAQSTQIPITAGAYVLGPDDVIGVKVVNYEKFDLPEVVVPPDGRISPPMLGSVTVAGKTTDQLADELNKRWSYYLNNISVSVSLVRKRRTDAVFVYGYAAKSGSVEFRPNLRLVDAIAVTGGSGNEGDLSHLVVTHRDGVSETIDLSKPETKANTPADILLKEGDLIYVPHLIAKVTVLGKVIKPGDVDFTPDMTVLDAIDKAGGPILADADLGGAELTHNGKQTPLNLDALYNKGDTQFNVKVEPGDSIEIPEIRNRTYVFGAVGHSGYYNFKPGDKVMDALTAQGGPTREADLKHVNVIGVNSTKDVKKIQRVDIDSYLRNGNSAGNILLHPGDVVFVPEQKKKSTLGLFSVLLGLNIVRSIGNIFSGNFF